MKEGEEGSNYGCLEGIENQAVGCGAGAAHCPCGSGSEAFKLNKSECIYFAPLVLILDGSSEHDLQVFGGKQMI